MPAPKDMKDQRFDMLLCLSFTTSKLYGGKLRRFYLCECDCGIQKEMCVDDLKGLRVHSCGCMRKSQGGMSGTPEYMAWSNMLGRCYNPEHPKYKDYGARGITVYQPWRDSFVEWYEYIGERPSDMYSLDRIHNHGSYEPGNIRWATIFEQNLNRR